MIREMALLAAGPLGLISGAGSGCVWVRHSGAGAEREKEGKGEGRERGREREKREERGGGLAPVSVSPVIGWGCHASYVSLNLPVVQTTEASRFD